MDGAFRVHDDNDVSDRGNAAALYSGSAPARLAVGICTGFPRVSKHLFYLSAPFPDRATCAALDALEDVL